MIVACIAKGVSFEASFHMVLRIYVAGWIGPQGNLPLQDIMPSTRPSSIDSGKSQNGTSFRLFDDLVFFVGEFQKQIPTS